MYETVENNKSRLKNFYSVGSAGRSQLGSSSSFCLLSRRKKETLVMVPKQWVLTSHDGRSVYVLRPQAKEKRMSYLRKSDHGGQFEIENFQQFCVEHEIHHDNLDMFDPKSDKGTLIGYLIVSKAYKVDNSRTLKVEESIHISKELQIIGLKDWNTSIQGKLI
ncbi:hypothetical protein CR513_20473, partial [Mucuna pruriens]